MRLLYVLSALVASADVATATLSDLCTTAQSSAFTTALQGASSCYSSTSYQWTGTSNPTNSQYAKICLCSFVSDLTIPSCSVQKANATVTLSAHYQWVMKTQCPLKATALNDTEAVVTTAPVTTTPRTTTPIPNVTTASPTPTPTNASTSLLDVCSVLQISEFDTALKAASSCLSSTSYAWGGDQNPTNSQLAEICKCPKATDFEIPKCVVKKPGATPPLSVHYDWVLTNQCPTLNKNGSSSSNTGLIAGIVGVVVVLALIIGIVIWRRKRSTQDVENQANNTQPSPHVYQRMATTPQCNGKRNDSRPSAASTVDTSRGSMRPYGSHSHNTNTSARASETGKWDDPAIIAVRIPFDAIFVGALVNRGGFGEVYRGTYRGETVAIKTLLPDRRKDLAQIDHFLGEVKLMASLDHERIVRFIGVAWNSLSDACLVVEYMENGDLRSVLSRWDAGTEQRMTGFDADKVKIALHVAHALVYLHSLQPIVVHRDLKSKNILLDANFDAKVTDFGISRERAEATMTAGVGSSLWMAPEVMMGKRYDEKADIFSFGVVLSELDTHELPYSHAKVTDSGQKLPEAAILQQVMLGRISVGFTDCVHPELVQLGRDCVQLNPKDRPATAQVLHRVHQVMKLYW